MTHKKRLLGLISMLLILVLAVMLAACGAKTEGEAAEPDKEPAAEATTEEAAEEKAEEPVPETVQFIDGIDTEGMTDYPLQIESISLFEDGKLRIVPTEDLLKNAETNNELVEGAVYPFDESGKVKEVYLVRFGNEGLRTIICLMDDGSLSAMSAKELINDHITVVWDNLTGRDTYVSVEERKSEDEGGYKVFGITNDGEEIELDFSLDF